MNKSQITFVPAKKEYTFLRMALIGPTSSGKTWTALTIATNLASKINSKIAVIDTEGRSSHIYADDFEFDVFDMSKQYSPAIYCQAIKAAANTGYKILVIDSLSHAWNGTGGVLDIVDQAGVKMGGNKWAGWSQGRPAQKKLVDTIHETPIHIIGTMRAKIGWHTPEKGKPKQIGLAPIQSDEFPYEFDLVGMMDMDYAMTITKTRFHHIPLHSIQTDMKRLSDDHYAWQTSLPEPRVLTAGETYLNQEAKREHLNNLFETLGIKNADMNAFKPYLKKLGITRFSEFEGSESELHAQITQIYAQLNPPNKIKTLEDLRKACRTQIMPNISDTEIARLSGVNTLTELAGMDLNLQLDKIVAAFEADMASTPPAKPKNITDIDTIKDNKDALPNKGQGDTDTPSDDAGASDSPKS